MSGVTKEVTLQRRQDRGGGVGLMDGQEMDERKERALRASGPKE